MISSTSAENPFSDARSKSSASASYLPLRDDERDFSPHAADSASPTHKGSIPRSRPPVLTLSTSTEDSPEAGEGFSARQKGKGRLMDVRDGDAWGRDMERGVVIEEEGGWVDAEDAYGIAAGGGGGGEAYPPMSEDDAEEKRIQENLALFAARDLARRRAARASKQFPLNSHTPSSSIASSAGKRGSMFGFGSLGRGAGDKEYETDGRKRDSNVPLTAYGQPASQGISSPPPSRPASANPFDRPSSIASLSPTSLSTPRPTQPNIESQPTPRVIPNLQRVESYQSNSTNSLEGSKGYPEQRSPGGDEDGYKGQQWRGGAMGEMGERGKEKWWHALCAWGEDLDEGGQDGQAGRTNPFE